MTISVGRILRALDWLDSDSLSVSPSTAMSALDSILSVYAIDDPIEGPMALFIAPDAGAFTFPPF